MLYEKRHIGVLILYVHGVRVHVSGAVNDAIHEEPVFSSIVLYV